MFASVTRLSHNGGAVRGVHWSVRSRWRLDAVHRTNHSRANHYSHRNVYGHSHGEYVRQALVDCTHVSICRSLDRQMAQCMLAFYVRFNWFDNGAFLYDCISLHSCFANILSFEYITD